MVYSFGASHAAGVVSAFVTAIIFGAFLLAIGAYYHTFIKPSVGIQVGGGWRSVFTSTSIGAMVGAVCGLVASGFYSILVAMIPRFAAHRDGGISS